MKFKGDIIITDPCYIMRDKKDYIDYESRPQWSDYMGPKLFKDMTIEEGRSIEFRVNKAKMELAEVQWEKENPEDWDICDCGDAMEALGFTNYLTAGTGYGDWSCTTLIDSPETPEIQQKLIAANNEMFYEYNFTGKSPKEKIAFIEGRRAEIEQMEKDSGVVLGHFCADAGLVSVFLLDEVLKYNPKYTDHLNNPHCVTWIKDFDGEVMITSRDYEYLDEETEVLIQDDEVSVVGMGNINFYTTQTGL